MNRKLIETLLLSELAEVKGGKVSKACYCTSGAGEIVLIGNQPGRRKPGRIA